MASKLQYCKFDKLGKCKFGSTCKFIHANRVIVKSGEPMIIDILEWNNQWY